MAVPADQQAAAFPADKDTAEIGRAPALFLLFGQQRDSSGHRRGGTNLHPPSPLAELKARRAKPTKRGPSIFSKGGQRLTVGAIYRAPMRPSAIRFMPSGDKMTRWRFRLISRPRRSQPTRIRLTVWSVVPRSEEHTSELQSLMRISYAVFCLKQKNRKDNTP